MLNIIQTINSIGGNFEKSQLAKTRNVLTKGRLSLFVGAMMAALFVSVAWVAPTVFHQVLPPKHLKTQQNRQAQATIPPKTRVKTPYL